MKREFLLIFISIFIIKILKAQPSRVKNDFNGYYKEQIGDNYLIIHTASYKDIHRENIQAYLPEGEYLILPPPTFYFGKDIEIGISNKLTKINKTSSGYYQFSVPKTNEYIFTVDAQVKLQPNELLFIVYKKYDPYKKRKIETLKYIDIKGNEFNFNTTSKKYSVIYFSSSLSDWSFKFAEILNSISDDFLEVDFLRLSRDSKEKLIEFEKETNLKNWILVPNIRLNSDLQFNELLSFPTFCIVDNKTQEIVYYHVADYINIDNLLRENLNEFLNK
ncbi:hypothetical protein C9994_10125 [Marivirga lumbricoides]|uniref:Uncharacterized protein n=1 Tax=Marivirga lumbricoides TaxID=1046115 RepID=A0A2T4DPP5_9BACT|nr:hypothetical protein C9994_10125 [Marivirga lumbricoides]